MSCDKNVRLLKKLGLIYLIPSSIFEVFGLFLAVDCVRSLHDPNEYVSHGIYISLFFGIFLAIVSLCPILQGIFALIAVKDRKNIKPLLVITIISCIMIIILMIGALYLHGVGLIILGLFLWANISFYLFVKKFEEA
ncbi:MAG: hypothetical protein IKS48_01760 [Eubacterium sp.]|nr:hypothetical protein [Eubacterium sp.]